MDSLFGTTDPPFYTPPDNDEYIPTIDELRNEKNPLQSSVATDQSIPITNEVDPQQQIPDQQELEPITAEQQAHTQFGADPQMVAFKGIKSMPEGPERDQALEDYFQTYYGMSLEEYRSSNFIQKAANNWKHQELDLRSSISAAGMGLLDFPIDVIGNLPGGNRLDDYWDKNTKFNNENLQAIRHAASIIIPSLYGGVGVANKVQALNAPRFMKAGGFLLGEMTVGTVVTGLSDTSEGDTLARTLLDTWPDIFGTGGAIPLPEAIITKDSDSPSVRTQKAMLEEAGLSFIGAILGGIFELRKPIMSWFKPLDKASDAYKTANIVNRSNPEIIERLAQVDETLSLKDLPTDDINVLKIEREDLINQLEAEQSFDNYAKNSIKSIDDQTDDVARLKIEESPDSIDFDPDIYPDILPDSANAKNSIPPGNVARNMADTTVIKEGVTEGLPAPLLTETMLKKGLRVGSSSRKAVLGLAKETEEIGNFRAVVEGIELSKEDMDLAAHKIFNDIMNAEDVDSVKALFADKSVIKTGPLDIEIIGEDKARAALQAIRELTDTYLGRNIVETSARTMDTLGREISNTAAAKQTLKPVIDDKRVIEKTIDKLQFLMDEWRINDFVTDKMKGWKVNSLDEVFETKTADELIQLNTEFKQAESLIHSQHQLLGDSLRQLSKTDPESMETLLKTFWYSNGDVNTITKLTQWAEQQVSIGGMLKSPGKGDKLNLFSNAAFGFYYNNMLSGISAIKAGIGNGVNLILKPTNAFLGHGLRGVTTGDWEGMKRLFYYYSSVSETNRRALGDMWNTIKKVNADPDANMKNIRKDFNYQNRKEWTLLDKQADIWKKEGNTWQLAQYNIAKAMDSWSRSKFARYGITAMSGVDGYTQTTLATHMSRLRAYDDVFTRNGGNVTPELLFKAEKEHYARMFDKDGFLTDVAVKNSTGEIALNLDDALTNDINRITTRYPFLKHMLTFPRTSINDFRLALSYTPVSLIPGFNKYSKTIFATTDDQIADALALHGIDMAKDPNAKALFRELQAEYTGRLVFTGFLTKSLWDYAMGGNIRGNGHHNAHIRINEKKELGYIPNTIKIGDKWYDYSNIPIVNRVLPIIGDLAYYASDIDSSLMEDKLKKLSWTLSATFLEKTPLTSLEPLVAIGNGDWAGFQRLIANSVKNYIPLSGAQSVLTKAIDSSLRELDGSIRDYILNVNPVTKQILAKQIDLWTGKRVNDVENPWLRIWNSFSGVPVSEGPEPWRQWLMDIGYNASIINRPTDGRHKYNPYEKEFVYSYVGKMGLWKEAERLMKIPEYKFDEGILRAHRATGDDLKYDQLEIKTDKFIDAHAALDKVIEEYKKEAEFHLYNLNPNIKQTTVDQELMNYSGNVITAREIAEQNLNEKRTNPQNKLNRKNNLLTIPK